jgi:hypothetical protein
MREREFPWRAARQVAAVILVMAALAGCTGRQLAELQSDLEALQSRSTQQRSIAAGGANGASAAARPPVDLASDYLALADAAGKQAGVSSVRADTQIAFHRVRGIAAWQAVAESAGLSSASLADARSHAGAAYEQGGDLCKKSGSAAPPRDCAVLELLPALVELELAFGTWVNVSDPAARRPLIDEAERNAPFTPAMEAFDRVAKGEIVRRALNSPSFTPWICGIYRGIWTNATARWNAALPTPPVTPEGVTKEAANTARMQAKDNWLAFSQTRPQNECRPPT